MGNREFMFCPRCGAVTPKGEDCTNCGYVMTEKSQEAFEEPVLNESVVEPDLMEVSDEALEAVSVKQSMEMNETMEALGSAEVGSIFEPVVDEAVSAIFPQSEPVSEPVVADVTVTSEASEVITEVLETVEEVPASEEQAIAEEQNVYFEEPKAEPETPAATETPKKEKKKKNLTWLWVLLILFPIVALIVLIIVLLVVLFFMFSGNISNNMVLTPPELDPSAVIDDGDDTYRYYKDFAAHNGERKQIDDFDISMYSSLAKMYRNVESDNQNDYFWREGDKEGIFGSHDMTDRDKITGPYYEPFYESFDDSYGYGYQRRYIKYMDDINGVAVDAKVGYYVLEGDNIPNLDEINTELYYQQCYDFIQYLRGKSVYSASTRLEMNIDNYITYNDDEILSIVTDVNVFVDGGENREELCIYGINVDLKNGVIMDNSTILDYDTIADEFRDKSDKQNGVSDTLKDMTDEEIKQIITDPAATIVFFTPVGVEVGFAYTYNYSGIGWITVSYEEYEDLLKYDFDNPTSVSIAPKGDGSTLDNNTSSVNEETPNKKDEDEDPLSNIIKGSDDL